MTKNGLQQFADQIATTLAASTRAFIERKLDERLQLERQHMREVIRAELDARLPPTRAADHQDGRSLQ